jgi:N-acetylglutamate synthase-like GNAT family acetyltransferase
MRIRQATDQDIPKIIELLKMSLGESLMPKSEAYWRWKHIDNPFGKSPVLVADEAGELIGVRAFMRWEWTDGNQIYKSVRAVDTATHPNYQGKGIFKKLTLQLIEQCQQDGVEFIFNTPNDQSRPGYLKMGWKEGNRTPIRILLVNPFKVIGSKIAKETFEFIPCINALSSVNVEQLIRSDSDLYSSLHTNYSKPYLIWRYSSVPVASYQAIYLEGENNFELLIYRLKKSMLGIEFRITDYLGGQSQMSNAMSKLLRETAINVGATYLTISGTRNRINSGIVLHRGPIVTIRNLGFNRFSELFNFNSWQPSIGDLELY